MIQLKFDPQQSFDDFNKSEWLETNGLGGWASTTISGCNTRCYHGLLVAANPPAERTVLVSKLDETIVTNGQRIGLSTNDYGNSIDPQGHWYLQSFSKNLYPEFIYETAGVQLRKSVVMLYGSNTTLLKYEVLKADNPFILEFLPLLTSRNYHKLKHADGTINRQATFIDNQFRIKLYENAPEIFIQLNGGQFKANPNWYFNFNYSQEKARGLEFTEDLFNPGTLSVEVKEGDTTYIILSTEDNTTANAALLFDIETERRKALLEGQSADPVVQQLVLAADQFIVQKDNLKTIIAGYHWFTDFSRDTMISLPGLCLTTKRFEDARKILSSSAQSVSDGMLPNRIDEDRKEPVYNSVDGTLWFFVAVYKYLQATSDKNFVLSELLPVMKDIIEWYQKGTRFNIHADKDGLLYAGENGLQLTWMDAKVNGQVITPRMGKPVEIQALWYNALMIYSELLKLDQQDDLADETETMADKVKATFTKKFWNATGKYLYDALDENDQPDTSVRPNQLFAISLPFALIDGTKAKSVIKVVEEKLYTPKGLRSLSPDDPKYIPAYSGNPSQRDASYHQGTVWSWLTGAYVDSLLKVSSSAPQKKKVAKVIEAFVPQLSEAGMGTISEIFDAEPPFEPKGTIAQAWSVAEILRVMKEYGLEQKPVAEKKTKTKETKPKAKTKSKKEVDA
jgi:predicted glycogen debranching enzyme